MKKVIFLPLFLCCCLFANGQDYLKLANDCFEKGDYDCAKRNYNTFQIWDGRDMSAQIKNAEECARILILADEYFKDEAYDKAKERYRMVLEKNPKDPNAKKQYDLCEGRLLQATKTNVPVEVKVETSLEISTPKLSFGEMGNEEKTVTITANAPWVFSQTSDWIKATIAPDSTVMSIACEPNISRAARKDSIIIQANDKEKVIIIEQAPVVDPLLAGKQMMEQNKTELAEKYFQLVIAGENVEDWNKLAKIYVDRGGEENYAKAFVLLQKSAAANNKSGLCNLGYMYEKGLGTAKNDAVAVNYYLTSAKQNYAPAQYNLGLMLEYGVGAKQNKKEAMEWYEKAAKQGFKQAQEKLKQ